MRIKRVALLLFVIGSLTILFFLFSLIASLRPDVSLDELLVSNPSFPTQWDSGQIPVDIGMWQQSDKTENVSIASIAPSAASRSWSDGGAITVFETILRFKNPIDAYWNFKMRPPEIVRFGDWPNFNYGCNSCYIKEWNDKSPYADQEHIVCAMGGESSCQVFYYWARHGQYIVLVELFAPNQGADNKVFASIVNEIDQWIYSKLNRP